MATEQMMMRMMVMIIIMLRVRIVLSVAADDAEDVRFGRQLVANSQQFDTLSWQFGWQFVGNSKQFGTLSGNSQVSGYPKCKGSGNSAHQPFSFINLKRQMTAPGGVGQSRRGEGIHPF